MLERRSPQMAEFLRWGDGFANAILQVYTVYLG